MRQNRSPSACSRICRLAMRHAAACPDWLAVDLAEIEEGADAVAGMAVIDPSDIARLPARLAAEERNCALLTDLLDEIDWLVDPDPTDPWPRHTRRSGASIAVRAASFAAVGGIPATAIFEDRALIDALRRCDARIRHSRDAEVIVSGRVLGRPESGMADTLRRALSAPGPLALEAASPFLRHRSVRTRDLDCMTALAQTVVRNLSSGTVDARNIAHLGVEEDGLGALAAAWPAALPTFGRNAAKARNHPPYQRLTRRANRWRMPRSRGQRSGDAAS